LERNTEQQASE